MKNIDETSQIDKSYISNDEKYYRPAKKLWSQQNSKTQNFMRQNKTQRWELWLIFYWIQLYILFLLICFY